MPRPPLKLTATYRLNECEMIQMAVEYANSYPQAMHEAKRVALDGIKEMLKDAESLARALEPEPTEADDG